MVKLPASIVAASALLTSGIVTDMALAQDPNQRSTDQYTCKDIMRQSGPDRDAAIAFIHGYLLGKSGATTFNVETLEKQTDAFVDRCLDNPNEKALDAMVKAKG
jgi:hypothetical protein